tara:strand:- start:2468 stop:2899 length:432 start_codon:yes stop_codon:yes gene_type:complete
MKVQTLVNDVTRPCTASYVPTDHSAGERWPGRDLRVLKQQTLFERVAADGDAEAPPRGAREACGVRATISQSGDARAMLGSGRDAAVPIVAMTVPFSVVVDQADPPPRLTVDECTELRNRINARVKRLAVERARAIAKRRQGA